MEARLAKKKTLIPLNAVYQELKDCRASVKLLLVDACRNDPQSAPSRARAEVDLESVTRPQVVKPPEGVAAFFSCRVGQKAYESESLKHGIFFYYVLQGLRGKAADKKGVVTVKRLSSYIDSVTDHVQKEFGGDVIQEPAARGEHDGTVLLLTRALPKDIVNSIGMKLVYIPPGKFTMGSPKNEKDRGDKEDQHEVEISKGFYMGAYEVTQEEYETVMGKNPSFHSASGNGKLYVDGLDTRRFPVENVSWEDATEFCSKLSRKENKSYDLPTEAEWEFACRAGSRAAYSFGDTISQQKASYGYEVKRPAKVGSYPPPNDWRLFDMHGNVWEWCKDWYKSDYYAESPPRDPLGPASGTSRVLRGGSFVYDACDCRSAARSHNQPGSRNDGSGFRVVCRVP